MKSELFKEKTRETKNKGEKLAPHCASVRDWGAGGAKDIN